MGGRFLIPFSSDKRAATGLKGGERITVELTLDTAPRTVEVPADLAAALDAAGLREAFDRLAPSARKAHVTNVEGAKAARHAHAASTRRRRSSSPEAERPADPSADRRRGVDRLAQRPTHRRPVARRRDAREHVDEARLAPDHRARPPPHRRLDDALRGVRGLGVVHRGLRRRRALGDRGIDARPRTGRAG